MIICRILAKYSQKAYFSTRPEVIFMLGGPGSGKGTQSLLISQQFEYKHLSAGELLRQEQSRKNSEYSQLIQKIIIDGKIVPSHITISLLRRSIEQSKCHKKFIIDGFPRNWQNYLNWNKMMGDLVITPFIVFLQCEENVLIQRLLKRGQKSERSDDNIETIKKRLLTFRADTIPVVQDFAKFNKTVRVNGNSDKQTVFKELRQKVRERIQNI